jgi:mannosyltransferase OCH1-like enzyme
MNAQENQIPKILHIIWVGDESKRPDNCIRTWVDRNPTWQIKIWGNDDLAEYGWHNAAHMQDMARKELNGVADLMRWEILYNEGGFVVDADSISVRPLDDWLLEHEAFACWENEIARPKLIAAGYVAARAGNPFFGQIINDLRAEPSVVTDMAWKTVGPLRLTQAHSKYQYTGLSILPSHYFIPEHFSGMRYQGKGPVYAEQHWASTRGNYDTLHTQSFK